MPRREPSRVSTSTRREMVFISLLWHYLATSCWCVSAKPISTGPPQCLMEETGLAPVPPSCPDIWMMSALALATPEATVPMPL